MTSFGDRVIATNGADMMQTLFVGDTNFVELSATAPVARYVAVVKDFLMVADTSDGFSGRVPYRVWWSALGDPTNWPVPGSVTAIQLQSDYQDLQQTDLGVITGLVSGLASAADVAVFCERGIYVGSFEGPPAIFSFRVAQGASGSISPLSIVMGHARDGSGAFRSRTTCRRTGFARSTVRAAFRSARRNLTVNFSGSSITPMSATFRVSPIRGRDRSSGPFPAGSALAASTTGCWSTIGNWAARRFPSWMLRVPSG
jgi:hypothetical protein